MSLFFFFTSLFRASLLIDVTPPPLISDFRLLSNRVTVGNAYLRRKSEGTTENILTAVDNMELTETDGEMKEGGERETEIQVNMQNEKTGRQSNRGKRLFRQSRATISPICLYANNTFLIVLKKLHYHFFCVSTNKRTNVAYNTSVRTEHGTFVL